MNTTSNPIVDTSTTHYQPADPNNDADAFGVSMEDLLEYTVLACPLPPPTSRQLTKWAAEHRHLRCRCNTRYPAQLIIVEGRPGQRVDLRREGRCPACNLPETWAMRFYPSGLLVTHDSDGDIAWIRPIDPKAIGNDLEEYVFWNAVDWTKQDCELADAHGVPHYKVWNWRHKLRKPRSSRHRHPRRSRAAAKYRNADWSKPDSELARDFGVTRQRIHQVRQKLRPQWRSPALNEPEGSEVAP